MNVSLLIPVIVTVLGLFLLIRLRFFFIRHPLGTLRLLTQTLSTPEARGALGLALAGTLGVGNIFGVAAGIMIGGAGSVFWLVISALFAMIIKYAESVLALADRDGAGGGMHRVLKRQFSDMGTVLSCLYAALCLFLSLLMGSAMQSNAVSDVACNNLDISPVTFAVFFVIIVLIGIIGGAEKIEKIASKLIPLATIIYILSAFSIIIINFSSLPDIILSIIRSAFSTEATLGGGVSSACLLAMREGYCRGILSNEAGAGTSAMAHSRADTRTAAEAGVCGMCEVFFDSLLLCPLTALAILCAVPDVSAYTTPMSLVSAAFSLTLGEWSVWLLFLAVAVFAYSTVICWYYYGSECMRYLFGNRSVWVFLALFFVFLILGAVASLPYLLFPTDLILLFMCILTSAAILRGTPEIIRLTHSSGLMGK